MKTREAKANLQNVIATFYCQKCQNAFQRYVNYSKAGHYGRPVAKVTIELEGYNERCDSCIEQAQNKEVSEK